jgi:hypothetical protein
MLFQSRKHDFSIIKIRDKISIGWIKEYFNKSFCNTFEYLPTNCSWNQIALTTAGKKTYATLVMFLKFPKRTCAFCLQLYKVFQHDCGLVGSLDRKKWYAAFRR